METSNMKKTVLATVPQKARIFGIYVSMLYELLEKLSFDKAQALLSDVGEKEVKKRLMADFEIQVGPWATQKENLERFWKTVFNYQINWDDFVLPEYSKRYSHLNIMPAGFTAEQIYAGIVHCTAFAFKKRSKYIMIDAELKDAKAIQSRPAGSYAWADGGTDEPDAEYLGKSYDDAIDKGLIFMGPVEYILSCALCEFLTGKVYDVKGVATHLSVLDSGGDAMCGGWDDDDGSRLGWYNRDGRNSDGGPRVVVFSTT
jgi:hypothetical protein